MHGNIIAAAVAAAKGGAEPAIYELSEDTQVILGDGPNPFHNMTLTSWV